MRIVVLRKATKQSARPRWGTSSARSAGGSATPSTWGPRCPSGGASNPRLRSVVADRAGGLRQGRFDRRDPPRQDLLEAGDGHRRQLEVRPLTDVEPSGARQVVVAVVDQAGEVVRARPEDPVLLQRLAVTVLLGDVQVAEAEGPEQPLVAHRDHDVGTERARRRSAGRRATGWRR